MTLLVNNSLASTPANQQESYLELVELTETFYKWEKAANDPLLRNEEQVAVHLIELKKMQAGLV